MGRLENEESKGPESIDYFPLVLPLAFGQNPGDPQWHHLLPQAVFKEEVLKRHGLAIDINDTRWGYIFRGEDHIGKGGVHSSGWNKEWQKWIDKMEADGEKITEEKIMAKLNSMKRNKAFKRFFEKGFGHKAKMGYNAWRASRRKLSRLAEKQAEGLLKKGAKKIGKKIPLVGIGVVIYFWTEDVQAKGLVGGTANSILDAIPIVGTGKGIAEMIAGQDLIHDLPQPPDEEDDGDDMDDDSEGGYEDGGGGDFGPEGGYDCGGGNIGG
jgi:hypothetical protein